MSEARSSSERPRDALAKLTKHAEMGGVGAKSDPSPPELLPSSSSSSSAEAYPSEENDIWVLGYCANRSHRRFSDGLDDGVASPYCRGAYDAIVTAATTSTVRRHHLELLLSIEATTAIRTS